MQSLAICKEETRANVGQGWPRWTNNEHVQDLGGRTKNTYKTLRSSMETIETVLRSCQSNWMTTENAPATKYVLKSLEFLPP